MKNAQSWNGVRLPVRMAPRFKNYPHEHKIWGTMLQRCFKPTCREFKHYGQRGITVCKRWQGPEGFANFLRDLGPQPFRRASIHRKNNNGNYEPRNVTWANSFIQSRHTRGNRHLKHAGRKQILADWALEKSMKPGTLTARLRRGWTVDEAISKPVEPRRPYAEWRPRGSLP